MVVLDAEVNVKLQVGGTQSTTIATVSKLLQGPAIISIAIVVDAVGEKVEGLVITFPLPS